MRSFTTFQVAAAISLSTGLTDQNQRLAKIFNSGVFHPILMNLVWGLTMVENWCIMRWKWLQSLFDLPARSAKLLFFVNISKWPNFVNFYPIWFKLVIFDPLVGKRTFEVTAAIFRPIGPSNQNSHFQKFFHISVFNWI